MHAAQPCWAPNCKSSAFPPQVADIDVTQETPVGHGRITCFSVYCGPELDLGSNKRRLWVDVLRGGDEVLQAFKPYLESEAVLKVRIWKAARRACAALAAPAVCRSR